MRATAKINRKSGEVVATLLAVWLGLASMAVSHWWSLIKPDKANLFLLKMGVWLPGWEKIGPYAGKETIGLIVWFGSWVLLFMLLKRHDYALQPWIYGFIIGVFVVTLLFWPPLIHAIIGWNPTTV